MQLLYSAVIVLIALVVAVQNASVEKSPFPPSRSSYCSAECESKYFRHLSFGTRGWLNMFLPLPTSEEEFNKTCNLTTQFLKCSESVTAGCRQGRPPMVRLGQIRDGYGYLCNEGAEKFLDVMDCLNFNIVQREVDICIRTVRHYEHKNPDAFFCNEIDAYHSCPSQYAEDACGVKAGSFLLNYVRKTQQELMKLVYCPRAIQNEKDEEKGH